jgi:hypothetical protein
MKNRFALVVTAMVAFAAMAIGAKAQDFNQLIVNVPYEFVVSGKTLPAGTYRLNRVESSASNGRQLIIRNVKNSEGVLVLPSEVQDARADKLGFTFREIGGEHFLSKIETTDYVFAVPVSKSEVLETRNKSHQDSKSSGASGN